MTVTLAKGANAPLDRHRVSVVLSWAGQHDVDVAALLCTDDGRVRSDDDFIFYNQPTHPSTAVSHSGKLRGSVSTDSLDVDLSRVEPEIRKIVISSSVDRGHFGHLDSIGISVVDPQSEAILLEFAIADATVETAMIAGEIYRRGDTWKFRAIGQGYSTGLRGVATDFGITVEDDNAADETPPAPPAPAYQPPPLPQTIHQQSPQPAYQPTPPQPTHQQSPQPAYQPTPPQPAYQQAEPPPALSFPTIAEFKAQSLAGKTRKARDAWNKAWDAVEQALPDGERVLAFVFAHQWEGFDGKLTQGDIVWSGELLATKNRFVQLRADGMGQIRFSDISGYNYREFRFGVTKVACTLVLNSGAHAAQVFSLPDKAKESRAFMEVVKSVMDSQPAAKFD